MRAASLLLIGGVLWASSGAVRAEGSAEFALPPLSSVTAIVERPLFAPERRGAFASAPAAPAVQGLDGRLLGIALRQGRAHALLSTGGTTRTLVPGQEVGGWLFVSADRRAAQFKAPDGRVLRLAIGDRLPPLQ